MHLSTLPPASLVLGLLLVSCDKGGSGTPCTEVSRQDLSGIDPADWPEGLSTVIDAYTEAEGPWTVEVTCEQFPEYDGFADLSFSGCTIEDMALVSMEGDLCDKTTLKVECTDGLFTFSGWAYNQFDGSGKLAIEDFEGTWSHWSVAADGATGDISVTGFLDDPMSGRVDVADNPEINCVMGTFLRPGA